MRPWRKRRSWGPAAATNREGVVGPGPTTAMWPWPSGPGFFHTATTGRPAVAATAAASSATPRPQLERATEGKGALDQKAGKRARRRPEVSPIWQPLVRVELPLIDQRIRGLRQNQLEINRPVSEPLGAHREAAPEFAFTRRHLNRSLFGSCLTALSQVFTFAEAAM